MIQKKKPTKANSGPDPRHLKIQGTMEQAIERALKKPKPATKRNVSK